MAVKCLQCGLEREMAPAAAAMHITGSCYHCPRYIPTETPETFDVGYIFGVVLGDGYLYKRFVKKMNSNAYGILLAVTDSAFADRFAGTLERCVTSKPHRRERISLKKANPKIGMPETIVIEQIVSLSSREWFDKISPVKHDRDFDVIRSKSLEFKKGFLQGMLDSEGYVNYGNKYTDISGKDLNLLAVVREIAEACGYKAKVYGPYPYARGVAHLRINQCLEKTVRK